MTQFSFNGVGVQFGATTVLRDVSFTVDAGEKWGVIGRNGSGKTTLFRILTGDQTPTAGTVAKTANLKFAVLDARSPEQFLDTVEAKRALSILTISFQAMAPCLP